MAAKVTVKPVMGHTLLIVWAAQILSSLCIKTVCVDHAMSHVRHASMTKVMAA